MIKIYNLLNTIYNQYNEDLQAIVKAKKNSKNKSKNIKELTLEHIIGLINDIKTCKTELDCKNYEILHHKKNINKFNFNLKYYNRILNELLHEKNNIIDDLKLYVKWYNNTINEEYIDKNITSKTLILLNDVL